MNDPLTLLAELAAEVAELRARVADLELGGTSKRWLTVHETGEYLGAATARCISGSAAAVSRPRP